MTNTGSSRRPGAGRRARSRLVASPALVLLGEVLTTSLGIALLALPAVTALPAFAAGCSHLRRHIAGERDDPRAAIGDAVDALRRGWPWALLLVVVALGGLVNLTSPLPDLVPGGGFFRIATVVVLLAIALVLLRACALWRRGAAWGSLLRRSAVESVTDARGTALLGVASLLAVTVVWMFAPLVVVVPGLLAFASVAVVGRRP